MLLRVRASIRPLVGLAALLAQTGCKQPQPEATTPPEPRAKPDAIDAQDPLTPEVRVDQDPPPPEDSGDTEPRDPYQAAFANPLGAGQWRCRATDDSVAITGWSYAGGPQPQPHMVVRSWTLWIDGDPVANRSETGGGMTTGVPLRRRPAAPASAPEPVLPTAPWTETTIVDREDGKPLFDGVREVRATLQCERSQSPPMP